jgi:hypothetical protein
MPSSAYAEFEKNLLDVHRLSLLHRQESGAGRGRRGLGHLTRGGLVLLCAAWERYVESVAIEGAAFLANRLPGYGSLPAGPRQSLVNFANNQSTPWTAAQLHTPAWAAAYVDMVKLKADVLNTPKHGRLQPLFSVAFGIVDIAAAWSAGSADVDAFVTLRGEVAHRGGQSQYIRFSQLEAYEADVQRYVVETDNFLSDHIRTLVNPFRRPWNRLLP